MEIGQGEESHSCRRCDANMNVPLVQRAHLLADMIGMIHILLSSTSSNTRVVGPGLYLGKASLAWFLEGGLLCGSVCMFQRRLLQPPGDGVKDGHESPHMGARN